MTPLSKLNDFSATEFLALLGGVYEHSEWVASRAYAQRPFPNTEALRVRMREIVDAASEEEQLALICAHPDLGGKLARAGALTPESTNEQAGLGLDRLSDEEYDQFTDLNTRYRERFGFPFIICARLTTRDGVLAAFQTRLHNSKEEEISEALAQIHQIAKLRIEDLLED